MKKLVLYTFFLSALAILWGCEKNNYPGGDISPYIAIYDIRNLYKGKEVKLTIDAMFGSNKITGVVVSDHSGGNLPEGLLVIQDSRRLSELRGISIPLGAEAAGYIPGDSLIINVEGGVLKRVDGILQITGIPKTAITKVSAGNSIPLNRVPISAITRNPDKYESVLSVIVKGGFNPLPKRGETLSGDRTLNDGFGNLTLHTEADAAFSGTGLAVSANYYGIVFNTVNAKDSIIPTFRIRKGEDITLLSSVIEIPPVVITGFVSDAKGTDSCYEYMQFMATQDIDFSVTPFAVVTTNNANASTPTGYPAKGWATGDVRTYKFSLTSGTAKKGTFFYVGASTKTINGDKSTSIASSNWIRAFNYSLTNGDGFGTKTKNLLANSGNAFGIAVFATSNVTVDTKPVDVIFVSTGGSLYTPGPPAMGYRIANTDFYDVKNPITLEDQPYNRSGSNTMALAYNTADLGYFYMLGGEFNLTLGKWTTARTQTNFLMTKSTRIEEIETEGATKLVE